MSQRRSGSQSGKPLDHRALVMPLLRPPVLAAMAGTFDFQQLAPSAALRNLTAVTARVLNGRFGIGAAMHEQERRLGRADSRDWRRADEDVTADVPGQGRNSLKIEEP